MGLIYQSNRRGGIGAEREADWSLIGTAPRIPPRDLFSPPVRQLWILGGSPCDIGSFHYNRVTRKTEDTSMEKETMPQSKDHAPPDASKHSYREMMQHNAARALKNGEELPRALIIALLEMTD